MVDGDIRCLAPGGSFTEAMMRILRRLAAR
jgi:hypothetical protein